MQGKINIQKSVVHTSNEQSKNEIKKAITITISLKTIKKIRDKLNKKYKTYSENKIEEIKDDLNKWKTSLVVQWLRICLPMQGILVRALVQEDLTRHRATKPVCHNY